MAKLQPKQSAFVTEYLKDRNATQAAIRAGYSQKTAYVQGSQLLGHPSIGAEIRRREEASAERVHVTKEWLTEKIAGSLEQAIKAAHYPGIGRLGELLARLHGLITEKRDIRVIRSIEDLTDEELAAVEMTGGRAAEGVRH